MTDSPGKREARSASAEPEPTSPASDDAPSAEPWLVVASISVLPIVAAAVLPRTFFVPLIVVTAALFAVSVVMLMVQLRRESLRDAGRESVQDTKPGDRSGKEKRP